MPAQPQRSQPTSGFCLASSSCRSSSIWSRRLLKCQLLGAVIASEPPTPSGAYLQLGGLRGTQSERMLSAHQGGVLGLDQGGQGVL